jgi:hypothetical protein
VELIDEGLVEIIDVKMDVVGVVVVSGEEIKAVSGKLAEIAIVELVDVV